MLSTTGYLTQRGKLDGKRLRLTILNMEIRDLFKEQVMAMFEEEARRDEETLARFCDALKDGIACYKKKCRVILGG